MNEGTCRFTVKGGGSNMIHISDDALLIIDVVGNRFIFPEFEQTEAKFLKIIDIMLLEECEAVISETPA